MKLALIIIRQEIIDKYNMLEKEKNGYVYIQMDKGMYGILQEGILPNDLLVKCLAPQNYHSVCHMHVMWKHHTHPVMLTLVMGDFRIKYVGNEHVDQLLNALKQDYEVTVDWTGGLHCGINLDWYYKYKTVDLSMPGYIAKALQKFQHKELTQPHHAHYPARAPQYGSKVQLTPEMDTSAALSPAEKK
jgi:hypothetical protein